MSIESQACSYENEFSLAIQRQDDELYKTALTYHENMCAKIVTEYDELTKVKSLLYDHYMIESPWHWSDENPTGFCIKQDNEILYIEDKHENNSIWLVCYNDSEIIIGFTRIVYRTKHAGIDIENYPSACKNSNLTELLKDPNVVESQRLYVRKDYRGTKCILVLSYGLAKLMKRYNFASIMVTQIKMNVLYKGLFQLIADNFDYGDGIQTSVYLTTPKDVDNAYSQIWKDNSYGTRKI